MLTENQKNSRSFSLKLLLTVQTSIVSGHRTQSHNEPARNSSLLYWDTEDMIQRWKWHIFLYPFLGELAQQVSRGMHPPDFTFYDTNSYFI